MALQTDTTAVASSPISIYPQFHSELWVFCVCFHRQYFWARCSLFGTNAARLHARVFGIWVVPVLGSRLVGTLVITFDFHPILIVWMDTPCATTGSIRAINANTFFIFGCKGMKLFSILLFFGSFIRTFAHDYDNHHRCTRLFCPVVCFQQVDGTEGHE